MCIRDRVIGNLNASLLLLADQKLTEREGEFIADILLTTYIGNFDIVGGSGGLRIVFYQMAM